VVTITSYFAPNRQNNCFQYLELIYQTNEKSKTIKFQYPATRVQVLETIPRK